MGESPKMGWNIPTHRIFPISAFYAEFSDTHPHFKVILQRGMPVHPQTTRGILRDSRGVSTDIEVYSRARAEYPQSKYIF